MKKISWWDLYCAWVRWVFTPPFGRYPDVEEVRRQCEKERPDLMFELVPGVVLDSDALDKLVNKRCKQIMKRRDLAEKQKRKAYKKEFFDMLKERKQMKEDKHLA